MTPAQIRQALLNTQQNPHNYAPDIFQAIQNDESPTVDSAEAFKLSMRIESYGQPNITISRP